MGINTAFISEFKHEAATTRRVLERIPASDFDWQPHPTSMKMGSLAVHVAGLVGWVADVITKTGLDFATTPYNPHQPQSTEELLAHFDSELDRAFAALETATDDDFTQNWTLRNGDQVIFSMPRRQTLRGLCFNHIIHHRGQLTVYLRMLGIPVPSIYGPSGDEGM